MKMIVAFRSILAHLGQIQATRYFFKKTWLRQLLDVLVSYHHIQYQEKLIIQ